MVYHPPSVGALSFFGAACVRFASYYEYQSGESRHFLVRRLGAARILPAGNAAAPSSGPSAAQRVPVVKKLGAVRVGGLSRIQPSEFTVAAVSNSLCGSM